MKNLSIERRAVMAGAVAITAVGAPLVALGKEQTAMYGLIGQMLATPGKRDDLVAILSEGTQAMPGCLSYIIAKDVANVDALWITEVWIDKEHHSASLKLPSVQAAITKGRPIIAGFGQRFETVPVGGAGLLKA